MDGAIDPAAPGILAADPSWTTAVALPDPGPVASSPHAAAAEPWREDPHAAVHGLPTAANVAR